MKAGLEVVSPGRMNFEMARRTERLNSEMVAVLVGEGLDVMCSFSPVYQACWISVDRLRFRRMVSFDPLFLWGASRD